MDGAGDMAISEMAGTGLEPLMLPSALARNHGYKTVYECVLSGYRSLSRAPWRLRVSYVLPID